MAFNAMENGVIIASPATGQQPPVSNISSNSRLPRKQQRAHEDEEQGKLFVGGLSWDTTQETLLRYFGRFGEVIDCVVMKNAESGRSRGFGFVTFSDPANIEAVLSSCPHTLDGRTIDPKACNPRSMQKPKKTNFFPKVFLGGLPSNITETDLRNFFSRYGEVCEIIIMYDQEKKKSRGFGFLSFSDDQAVNRACAEHFVNIQNKQVEIKRAEPRAQAATWNKDSVDQWGGSPLAAVSGGPPPIPLVGGSPMQQQQHHHQQHVNTQAVTNGGQHLHHQGGASGAVPPPQQQATHYSWGASGGHHPANPQTTAYATTQYGSTQIVPWGHHPPSAPTPPTAPGGQWGFASPPPAQFPVYHPPPPPSVTPQPSYWNPQPTPPPAAPPPPQTYSAYGSYAAGPQYPPPPSPVVNKAGGAAFSVGTPDFYHQNTITMGQPPVAMSPPGAYNSDLASSLGPQRGGTTMYSTQPSQYHPYRRS